MRFYLFFILGMCLSWVAFGQEIEGKQVDKDIGEMVLVKGGTFLMGCTKEQGGDCQEDEMPVRKVVVHDFYIGKYEVTFDEYDVFCEDMERKEQPDWNFGRDKYPVIGVYWYDAVEYCNWLSEREGLEPCYKIDKENKDLNNKNEEDDMKWTVECDFTKNGYRLPTEAEWEYAARGGRASKGYKWAGTSKEEEVGAYGNYWWNRGGDSYDYTKPVGRYRPNELGIYDMSGNVWEWCWDWYAPYILEDEVRIYREVRGATSGVHRVLRGGCWDNSFSSARVSKRGKFSANFLYSGFGFRLVRNP